MPTAAYYNEFDPETAAWLRELIRRDLIAPGDVDERDIRDVVPTELSGYRQCHFFAGVGTWSYALRRAGWDDSQPVWTVSCPCQPFSAAGKGEGFADERHLWPAWFHLAGQCRPDVVFGEQVESDEGKAWLDLVWDDMEALGYAFGPLVFPAAGVGAPHGRHRIYFVADSERAVRGADLRRGLHEPDGEGPQRQQTERSSTRSRSDATRALAHAVCDGGGGGRPGAVGATSGRVQGADGERQRVRADARPVGRSVHGDGPAGPANGFWRDADWLRCRDGLWRATRPGTFPLVARTAPGVVPGSDSGQPGEATAEARVVRLRGYGNGLCAPAAEEFIRAYMETIRA